MKMIKLGLSEQNTIKPQYFKQIDEYDGIKRVLDNMFPEQEYDEKSIQKTKEILGDLIKDFSKEEIKDITTKIEFLVDVWLDEYEKQIFNGLTL